MSHPLMDGPVDVHAHMLPPDGYVIPTRDGRVELTETGGQLHLGSTPIAVSAADLSDVDIMLADMDRAGVAVRVVSPPPYAFPVVAQPDRALAYCRAVNDGLVALCGQHADRLLPFGIVPAADADAAAGEVERLHRMGVRGVSLPPVVGDAALGDLPLRHVLDRVAAADLAVLVHPMQQARPGLSQHYLRNLLGNPVETAAAIGSCVLGGVFTAHPSLRICFVHGAGCAPYVLGRWDHGWRVRADVAVDTDTPPSQVVAHHVYADTLTHSVPALHLLQDVVTADRMLLGSDYPFDMGDRDPVGSARAAGLDPDRLRANALRWLALSPGD